jgi:hypothetical protein
MVIRDYDDLCSNLFFLVCLEFALVDKIDWKLGAKAG